MSKHTAVNPRYDDYAEQSLLSLILNYEFSIKDAINDLTFKDFYNPKHQAMFSAMAHLNENEKEIDVHLLKEAIRSIGLTDKIKDLDYVNDIYRNIPEFGDGESLIKTIKEKSIFRAIDHTYSNTKTEIETGTIDIKSALSKLEESLIKQSSQGLGPQIIEIDEALDSTFELINTYKENQDGLTGIDTGFTNLNKVINGLQREDLLILAARPGKGKTAFAINLALSAAKENSHVFMFSLEMGAEQLLMRMLANLANVDSKRIKSGKTDEREDERLEKARLVLENCNISFSDKAGLSVNEIRTACRKKKAQGKLDFVIIDYLQLMTGRGNNRQEEVSYISRSLKEIARELKVPVMALSQLSRSIESRKGSDAEPRLSDLRESGSIEQDADIIGFLYTDMSHIDSDSSEHQEYDNNSITLSIAKNRHGEIAKCWYTFQRQFAKFSVDESKEEESVLNTNQSYDKVQY